MIQVQPFFYDYCTHFTSLPLKVIRSRIKIVINWGHINWICAPPPLRINTQHWVHLKGSYNTYWRWKLLSHDANGCEYTIDFLLVKLIRSVSWKWILETFMLTQRYPSEKTLQSVCVFWVGFRMCLRRDINLLLILRAKWTSLIYLWESYEAKASVWAALFGFCVLSTINTLDNIQIDV